MDVQAEINRLNGELENTTDVSERIAIRNQITEYVKLLPHSQSQGKFIIKPHSSWLKMFEYILYNLLDISIFIPVVVYYICCKL